MAVTVAAGAGVTAAVAVAVMTESVVVAARS